MNMSSSISSKGSPKKLFATVLKGIKKKTQASTSK